DRTDGSFPKPSLSASASPPTRFARQSVLARHGAHCGAAESRPPPRAEGCARPTALTRRETGARKASGLAHVTPAVHVADQKPFGHNGSAHLPGPPRAKRVGTPPCRRSAAACRTLAALSESASGLGRLGE